MRRHGESRISISLVSTSIIMVHSNIAVPRMRSLPRVCTLVQTAAVLWSAHIRYMHCGPGLSGVDLATSKDQRKHLEPGYNRINCIQSMNLQTLLSPDF